MPAINSEHARSVRYREPYHFQRPFVQMGSSYPRPPQPAIQPNQLRKREEVSGDFWGKKMRDYEEETGIPAMRQAPRVLNWRLI